MRGEPGGHGNSDKTEADGAECESVRAGHAYFDSALKPVHGKAEGDDRYRNSQAKPTRQAPWIDFVLAQSRPELLALG